MATRLPYGAEVSYELLKRIEEGEEYLRSLLDQGGKKGNIRLRIHDRYSQNRGGRRTAFGNGQEAGADCKKA